MFVLLSCCADCVFEVLVSLFPRPPSPASPTNLTENKTKETQSETKPQPQTAPSSSSSCSFLFATFVAVFLAGSSSPHIQSHQSCLPFLILLSVPPSPSPALHPSSPEIKIKTHVSFLHFFKTILSNKPTHLINKPSYSPAAPRSPPPSSPT